MPSLQSRGATTPVSAAADNNSTISNPAYIVGIVIIVLILLGAGIWLGRRFIIKRRNAKREANDIGFLSVKGLVPDQLMSEKGLQCVPLFFCCSLLISDYYYYYFKDVLQPKRWVSLAHS